MDSKDRLQPVEIDGGHRRDMLHNRGGGCSPSKIVREDSLSVSWNPSWLGSGVSPRVLVQMLLEYQEVV